ncbi:MAG TPA: rod shape-determining protein MreD [Clostridia bacterium]|nr:rod shape-determining protein MreD [Clostridia bacterium]
MRFRWWAFFLFIALGACAQGTFAHVLAVRSTRPDFLLILCLSIGMGSGPIRGCQAGFIAGFLIDLMGGRSIGLQALSYSVGGFVAGWVTSGPLRQSPLVYVVSGLTGSLSAYLVAYALLASLGFPQSPAKVFGGIIWPASLYDALLTLPASLVVSKVLVCKGQSHVIEGT